MVTVINGSTENCSLLSSGGLVSRAHDIQNTLNVAVIQGLSTSLVGPHCPRQFDVFPTPDTPDPVPKGLEYELTDWMRCAERRENLKLWQAVIFPCEICPKSSSILNNTRKGNVLK